VRNFFLYIIVPSASGLEPVASSSSTAFYQFIQTESANRIVFYCQMSSKMRNF